MNLTLSKLKLVFLFTALELIFKHHSEFIQNFRYDLMFQNIHTIYNIFDTELKFLIKSFEPENLLFTGKFRF